MIWERTVQNICFTGILILNLVITSACTDTPTYLPAPTFSHVPSNPYFPIPSNLPPIIRSHSCYSTFIHSSASQRLNTPHLLFMVYYIHPRTHSPPRTSPEHLSSPPVNSNTDTLPTYIPTYTHTPTWLSHTGTPTYLGVKYQNRS